MRQILAKAKGVKPVLHNILWLFFDKALRMGVGVIVGVWIARYLGPDNFGILNYALAFVAIVGAAANLGLDNIVLVELIKKESSIKKLLATAFLLRLVGAAAGVIFMMLLALITEGSMNSLSYIVVIITSFILIFQTFDVIDLYYQANLLSRKTVLAKNIAFIIASAVKVLLIIYNYNIIYFAIATLFEYGVGAILMYFSLKVNLKQLKVSLFDSEIARNVLKRGFPLIFTALSIMLYMRIDQIMIKFMLGAAAVGQYTAAIKLTEIWFFVPVVIVSSLMPSLVRSRSDSKDYNNKLIKLFSLMIYLGLVISLVITFSSDLLIHILYGDAYRDASMVLKIHVWSCIFVFLGVASSQYLLIENKTKVSLYRTVAGVIVNVALNIFLIPFMGIKGAAFATLVSYFVSAVLSNVLFSSTTHINYMYLKSLNFVHALKQK